MASVILRMIVDTEIFNNKMARVMPMPISIKEAYYEVKLVQKSRTEC